jgi:GNAT superfamily N-acetyltransferase
MISDLTVKVLNKEERKKIYKEHMKQDFPKNELRPLHMIETLIDKGNYYTYGVFQNESLVAYAYFWEEKEKEILLFDYFAVVAGLRSQGYGTEAMKVVLDICKDKRGVILEAENPEKAESEEERITRCRRISFYEKCGLCMSDVKILLFGVEYSMMYWNLSEKETEQEIISVMQSLYKKSLPRPIYEKMLKIL